MSFHITFTHIADAKVQSRILQGGYLYNYRSRNRFTKEIAILTNSDILIDGYKCTLAY
jgi:hypothetical protein